MSCIKGGICEHGGCSNCLGEPNIKLQEDWKDKVNSGHHTFAEVKERARLVAKYLELENEFTNEGLKKANKLEAIIRQMSRHENLNKEDMPLVCEILQREVNSILSKLEV